MSGDPCVHIIAFIEVWPKAFSLEAPVALCHPQLSWQIGGEPLQSHALAGGQVSLISPPCIWSSSILHPCQKRIPLQTPPPEGKLFGWNPFCMFEMNKYEFYTTVKKIWSMCAWGKVPLEWHWDHNYHF